MKICTWNVNSIRARIEHVKAFLADQSPDVLCLQETKVHDDQFPFEPLEDEGYNVVIHGQKAYNGVAILSHHTMEDVVRGLPGIEPDDKRVIGCTVGDTMVLNLYVPNGQDLGTDKFAYKLRWLQALRAFLDERYPADEKVVVCGDFNITFDDRDVYDPDKLRESIHCSTPEREALAHVMEHGLHDALRRFDESAGIYTWWHYMRGAFQKDRGLRIDHMLLSGPAMEACQGVEVHKAVRGEPSASDHAPVTVTLA